MKAGALDNGHDPGTPGQQGMKASALDNGHDRAFIETTFPAHSYKNE
jgi:hypothetical protein